MTAELTLQAGGTLRTDHIYIKRSHDQHLLDLLLNGQYANVLAPRQMGKSSLMVRTTEELRRRSIHFSTIDLASELGTPETLSEYYQGLLLKISRDLELAIDIDAFWRAETAETVNQKLLRFFREEITKRIVGPMVIFLDEIDSTLKLAYTDDLFTAIRGMYNERQLVPAYGLFTFCLLGVATPNELIKNQRTTAYNIGQSLELRDFDREHDDLSPLSKSLSDYHQRGDEMIERILYWTDGQPYLTIKLCADLKAKGVDTTDGVDRHVEETFRTLDQLTSDIHFAQILRFVQERLTDSFSTLQLYANILNGSKERDETTLTHAELKLSGLVKRGSDGYLKVRNRIYRRLFDDIWIDRARPSRLLAQYKRSAVIGWATAASLLVIFATAFTLWQAYIVAPGLNGAWAQINLMIRQIDVTRQTTGLYVNFPGGVQQDDFETAIPFVKILEPEELNVCCGSVRDLSPVNDIVSLQRLDFSSSQVSDISPLEPLTRIQRLRMSSTKVSNLSPLSGMTTLQGLDVAQTPVSDATPLSKLVSIRQLDLSDTKVDLAPLAGLANLQFLYLKGIQFSDSASAVLVLSKLVSLVRLNLSETNVVDLTPLANLPKLRTLNLTKAYRLSPDNITRLIELRKQAGNIALEIER